MALRFRRTVKIAPGLKLNLSKKGISLSAGVKGANITMGKNGVYGNAGIPGTGLSYRKKLSGTAKTQKANSVLQNEKSALEQELNSDLDALLDIHLACLPPREGIKYTKQKLNESFVEKPKKWHFFLAWFVGHALFAGIVPNWDSSGFFVWTIGVILAFVFLSKKQKNTALKEWNELQDTKEKKWNDLINDSSRREELFENLLQEIDWPRQTLCNFEFRSADFLAVDIDFPEVEDMPEELWLESARGGKIKQLSDTQIRKNYARHIHGICMLVVSLAFRCAPELHTVQLSGYTQRINKATGREQDDYILSVQVERPAWENLNFSTLKQIDPVEALTGFHLRRDMSKTCIFKTIEPFS